MRRFLSKILLLIFILVNIFANIQITNSYAFPVTYAEGIYIMDSKTGEVLYEQNSDMKLEPASTTKVMTAIIAIENCDLDEKVTIGDYPPLVDGSAIGIVEGEVYTIKELLLALLLESANDAAEAIGQHIAGSNEAFGELMTKKAKEIGATNTVFKNPSGLSEDGHVTTAHDLALIMNYALGLDDFVRISRTPFHFYENHPFSDGSEKWATNRNNCLGENSSNYYPNLYSGKTGYTPEANHTYTAAAKKDNQTLVLAMLNATDKFNFYDSVGRLFDWGFENFKTEKIISKGEILDEYNLDDNTVIPLIATEDIYYTFNINNSDSSKLITTIEYKDKNLSTSSIKKGDILFNGSVLVNGTEYVITDLASGADREYTKEIEMQQTINNITKSNFFIPSIIILFIVLIVIIILVAIKIKIKNKKRSRRNYSFLKNRR